MERELGKNEVEPVQFETEYHPIEFATEHRAESEISPVTGMITVCTRKGREGTIVSFEEGGCATWMIGGLAMKYFERWLGEHGVETGKREERREIRLSDGRMAVVILLVFALGVAWGMILR